MAIEVSDIQPVSNETAPVQAGNTPEETASAIPDEVLELPAIRALLQGTPPAASAPRDNPPPEAVVIGKFMEPLAKSGFGFYRSKDDSTVAMFNQRFVSPEEIKLADEKGRLLDLAPPFSEIQGALTPSTTETPPAPAPAPTAGVPTPPPGLQKSLANKRVSNLLPGSPTSGPAPGAGRILNSVLKPVV